MTSKTSEKEQKAAINLKKEHCLEAFISLLFLGVFILLMALQIQIELSLDLLLLVLISVFAISGYILILNERLSTYLEKWLSKRPNFRVIRILVVPLITIMVVTLSFFSTHSTFTSIQQFLFILVLYILYTFVPIVIAEIMTNLRIFSPKFLEKNSATYQIIRFFLGAFIIFWGWWFIEFDWLPPLINNLPLAEFLGILSLSWSFLIILQHHIPRELHRYLTISTFKTIGIWIAILIVAIVPAAVFSAFIQYQLADLFEQGIVGLLTAIVMFFGIFFFTAFIEEFLFRALIFQWTVNSINAENLTPKIQNVLLILLFAFVSLLIVLTPYFNLADPITEGPVKDIPLPAAYATIGIIYFVIGIILVFYLKKPEFIILVWSSMIFGWAHFEDWRYILFATIAGIGYCDTYRRTKNVFASATLHTTVNFIWALTFAS